MATLNEIAYSIASKIGMSNDLEIRETIKFDAVNARAMFIRRDIGNNPMSRNYLQSLPSLPIICADINADCGNVNLGLKSGMLVHRTKDPVPETVRTKGSSTFYYVGTIDKQTSFQEIQPEMIAAFSATKYTSNQPRFFLLNNYIYLINLPNKNLKYINITGVWEDPRHINSVCDSCYSDDDEFPIPADMVSLITEYLIKIYSTQRAHEDQEVRVNNN
jgi:hypothetical protein